MKNLWIQKAGRVFKNVWFLWVLCLILNIITFSILYFKIRPEGQSLALKYNVLAGVLWYGKGQNLYLIPGIAAAISIINFVLFKKLRGSPEFYSMLCLFASLTAQLAALVSIIFLIKVN